jgi:hypothetical protein
VVGGSWFVDASPADLTNYQPPTTNYCAGGAL